MKAIVYERYGPPDVLELREVKQPAAGERDVLVRVHATAVSAGDWHLLTATMWAVRLYQGLFRPKRRILGYDFAGTVEAVGPGVTRTQPGDEVFGESSDAGAFAEFVRVPESGVAPKPASLSWAEAAAVPVSALTALQGLRDKGRIRTGQDVLINGASGGVGTFAVQIAKSYGAEVTGVASMRKLDLVRSLGADHVVDYSREDFTQREERYDLVLDLAGKHPLADCRRTLAPEGIYVAAAGPPLRTLRAAVTGGKRTVGYVSQPNREDLGLLAGLLESGQVKPVVDRRYPLAEVPEAMRYYAEGNVRGKIVIMVQP